MESAALIGAHERLARLQQSIREEFTAKREAGRKAKAMNMLDPDFDAAEAGLLVRRQYQAASRIRFLSAEVRRLKGEIEGMEANPRQEFMGLFLGAAQARAYNEVATLPCPVRSGRLQASRRR